MVILVWFYDTSNTRKGHISVKIFYTYFIRQGESQKERRQIDRKGPQHHIVCVTIWPNKNRLEQRQIGSEIESETEWRQTEGAIEIYKDR